MTQKQKTKNSGAPKGTSKKIELATAVEEGVALLGLVARMQDDLDRAGLSTTFPIGKQMMVRHQELMAEWNKYVDHGPAPEKMAYTLALYRRCRDAINQVQSSLQNLIRPRGAAIGPAIEKDVFSISPTDILAEIVRAKENWAYIDAHPQVVIARAG